MSAPTSRPVHPCVVSVFDGSNGADYSTWAHLTTDSSQLPNLVTAHASTLKVYTMDEASGKLLLTHSFTNLAGSVCYLETLHTKAHNKKGEVAWDSLLVGLSGHPRLAIVSLQESPSLSSSPTLLLASSLLDLTQALQDNTYGSITPLEQDLIASTVQEKNIATTSVILGGGIAVALITLTYNSQTGWLASQPYLLPLATLKTSISTARNSKGLNESMTTSSSNTSTSAAASNSPSISTGFGDILSVIFLPGYIEPTILLLHSNPLHHGGQAWSGRLGRPHYKPGTRYGLLVTAISVTIYHSQSAVLWSVEVPADAHTLTSVGKTGAMVVCCNSFVSLNNAGDIDQILAVNGWVKTTCPSRLLNLLKPNPKPLPKLSIQLDGSSLSFCSDTTAFVSLRCGHLYLLQRETVSGSWGLMPLGRSIGSAGQVTNLLTYPFSNNRNGVYQNLANTKGLKSMEDLCLGLLFICSRMGDSCLLGYALSKMPVIWKEEGNKKLKEEATDLVKEEEMDDVASCDSYDAVLRMEENALYAAIDGTVDQSELHLIAPSSDEESDYEPLSSETKAKKDKLTSLVVVHALTSLDSLKNLGPLGAACEGPVAAPHINKELLNPNAPPSIAPSTYVMPCGYGSSGGIALLSIPGRDIRSVLIEEDCLDVQSVFSLPTNNLVLLGMSGTSHCGIRALRLQTIETSTEDNNATNASPGYELSEVNFDDWCSSSKPLQQFFADSVILSAAEFINQSFVIVSSEKSLEPTDSLYYGVTINIFREIQSRIELVAEISIPDREGRGSLLSITPMVNSVFDDNPVMVFGCTWSAGSTDLITFNQNGVVHSNVFEGNGGMDADMMEDETEKDEDDLELERFYASKNIVAVDLFHAPSNFFDAPSNFSSHKIPFDDQEDEMMLDGDEELYGMVPSKIFDDKNEQATAQDFQLGERTLFLGICRQSGALEILTVPSSSSEKSQNIVWAAKGCGHGVPFLCNSGTDHRIPKFHKVFVREMRFFLCGPSIAGTKNSPEFRPFCLAMESNTGDLSLYTAERKLSNDHSTRFQRLPLKIISRPSQEQSRHHAKLRRKGIIKASGTEVLDDRDTFRQNNLHLFSALSGQDGLFARLARPLWIVAQRGKPEVIGHRCRHGAPAGGKPRPVSGFCSLGKNGAFLTLHERVGRVGSQRLTVYRDISNVFNQEGLLPGGGLCVEKIGLGVTVRRIQFIDDGDPASGAHPLYAVLVSREVESGQTELNDDGLTNNERDDIEQEKESTKIKRQVEADLGGFDVEQEWVEEIERDDCFQIDTEFGGAPPLPKSCYSLWIVDAANNWMVMDSYELGEYEHALAMQVMWLTEFQEEPGSSNTSSLTDDEVNNIFVVTVGTGFVDQNGEDVSSKGRVLMFEVKRLRQNSPADPVAELAILADKQIFHGAVTTLSCLTSEGRNRLVIGAGADVNVEQWGNGKLTQVGFFRATMQVLDILLFKNFLLLSDAYDSLYFLVWRESDKSLTLLAKDYDPMVVYAAGTMSRGGSLTFLCQDDRQNLQFFQYAPGEAAARGGNKLVCRADIHLGTQTTSLLNHTCRSSILISSATPGSTLTALKQQDTFFGRNDDDKRIGVHFGNSDGGFGAVVPLSEQVYWRLTALQSVMANSLESNCALNTRAWRLYRRSYRRGGCRSNDRKKGVIDGDLVFQYGDLALTDQEDLASAIGSTVGLILDNLLEIKCASMII